MGFCVAYVESVNEIILYSAPGCCLCDRAYDLLQRINQSYPFNLIVKDITLDDVLHRNYLERIPVVVVNGSELFEYEIDEKKLCEKLNRRNIDG